MFLTTLIGTLIKYIIYGAIAFCGIKLGIELKKRKQQKK